MHFEVISWRAMSRPHSLEIIPWSSVELLWIISHCSSGAISCASKMFLNDLIGQPLSLQHHISTLISSHKISIHETDAISGKSEIYIGDFPVQPQPLHHEGTYFSSNTSLVNQKSGWSETKPEPDFSYLMILELQNFYHDKFANFNTKSSAETFVT